MRVPLRPHLRLRKIPFWRLGNRLKTVGRPHDTLLVQALRKWKTDRCSDLAGALAFSGLVSLMPLLVLLLSLLSPLAGEDRVRTELFERSREILGPEGGKFVEQVFYRTPGNSGSYVETVGTFLVLLWGAHLVFSQLRRSLNVIWGAPQHRPVIRHFFKARLSGMISVFALAALVVGLVFVTAALASLGRWAPQILPYPVSLLGILDFLASFLLLALLLALVYKILPDLRVAWRDVWSGAIWTALLLSAGKAGFGFYLGRVNLTSLYGATVSLVILLVGVYLQAQLMLFGAVLTATRAERRASRMANPAQPHRLGRTKPG